MKIEKSEVTGIYGQEAIQEKIKGFILEGTLAQQQIF